MSNKEIPNREFVKGMVADILEKSDGEGYLAVGEKVLSMLDDIGYDASQELYDLEKRKGLDCE